MEEAILNFKAVGQAGDEFIVHVSEGRERSASLQADFELMLMFCCSCGECQFQSCGFVLKAESLTQHQGVSQSDVI